MLIPDAVVPIPIILDLTKTSFGWSFSNWRDKTPESMLDIKVPIKLEVGPSSVSA